MSKEVRVSEVPLCDMCTMNGRSLGVTVTKPAYADARIPSVGSWANVCREHFDAFGCELGTGHGQELVV